MAIIKAHPTDSSPESFLITVVICIIIAGFALYAFRIFPFDANNMDSVTIQMKEPVANPEPSIIQ